MTEKVPNNDVQERHRFALPFTAVAVAFSMIYAIGFSGHNTDIWFFERPSIASAFSWIGAVIGMGITILCYRRLVYLDDTISNIERLTERQSTHNYVARFATGLFAGIATLVITLWVFLLLDQVIDDFTVAPLVAIVLITVYGGLVAYGLAFWASMLETENLLRIVGIAVVFGLIGAVARVSNPTWYKRSISYMSHDSGSALIFRMTFFIAGSVMLAVTRDLINNLRYIRNQDDLSGLKFRVIQGLLLALPMLLAGIGIFPTSVSEFSDFMHNVSSHGGAAAVFILMIVVLFFGDLYPRNFLGFTLAMIVVVVACWAGWQVIELYNFVAFEFLLIFVMGFWMMRFFNLTQRYIEAYRKADSVT